MSEMSLQGAAGTSQQQQQAVQATQHFSQFFGNMTGHVGATGTPGLAQANPDNIAGTPVTTNVGVNSTPQAAPQAPQGNMISQLVASLRAQQQAQVQAALVRAFGPGANAQAPGAAGYVVISLR